MLHSFGDIWFNGRERRQKIYERRVFVLFICLVMMKMMEDKKRGGWSLTFTPTKIHPHQLGEKMFVT